MYIYIVNKVMAQIEDIKIDDQQPQKITAFKRMLPQFLAAMAKNLIVVNKALFDGFPSIVIPSLTGHSRELNPNEMLNITDSQASWLSSLAFIGHPIGGVVGGQVCDVIGRRRTMMFITAPIFVTFCVLGFASSYELICIGFAVLGFVFGLKEAPTITYVSEISEPSIRGTLMAIGPLASSIGLVIVYLFGSFLSWREVSFICAAFPIIILISVYFVPESPMWLLSKDRTNDAQSSLQWLRGCVPPKTIHNEFTELQQYAVLSNACASCAKQSIECTDSRATFCTNINEFKRKRSLKPFILIVCLQFFVEFSGIMVWTPYIIQVLKAHGIPIQANFTTVIMSVVGFIAHVCLLLSVNTLGKRKICLCSNIIVVLSCLALGIYGFVFFPPGWTSFQSQSNPTGSNGFEIIREKVGNYGYLALVLVLVMQFCTKMGAAGATLLLVGEVFPFKVRSFLSGVAVGCRYIFASIATKTYYDIEMWLSLPGAIIFYGSISLIGFIVMFLILPETEHRSLHDIELHYSDNLKGITDIDIPINSKVISNYID